MRYCSLEDIKQKFTPKVLVQLTNDDPCATEPDTSVIESAVTNAEERIDGYLRGRYTLPFETVPTMVKEFAVDLVRYALYDRRPEGCDIPDSVVRGRKDALYALERIQLAKLHLGAPETGLDQKESGEIRVRSGVKRFSDSLLDKYQ